jgi:hypothetical protein
MHLAMLRDLQRKPRCDLGTFDMTGFPSPALADRCAGPLGLHIAEGIQRWLQSRAMRAFVVHDAGNR